MPDDSLTTTQREFLASAKEVAIQMGENGRALTGVIGELSCCDKLGLTWEPGDGYDAKDPAGKTYQIKTRKNWTQANKDKHWWEDHKVDQNGRMGRFQGKKNYAFHFGIYVELDEDWEVWEIWLCKRSILKKQEEGNKLGLKPKQVVEVGQRRYTRRQ